MHDSWEQGPLTWIFEELMDALAPVTSIPRYFEIKVDLSGKRQRIVQLDKRWRKNYSLRLPHSPFTCGLSDWYYRSCPL